MLQLSTNETVQTLETLPIPAGLKLDRSELQHLRSDLNRAISVQRHMLPRNTKQLATARYAGTSSAAHEIGGDYYDFLDLGPDTLGFVLADVSGKGVASALLMANLQAAIRCECAHGIEDLGAMLQRVNAHFFGSTLPAQYATLFFGRYNDRTRRLEYINCAQQPAIVMRSDRSIERLETTALPLGLLKDWTGEMKMVELGRGDMLCVCSDGVVEAGLESECEFGEDGLTSVLKTSPDREIELTIARIAQAVYAYVPNGPADDMTIAGLRVV
jgi:serine phosphatase RsbU (regulator of sigma subunit)